MSDTPRTNRLKAKQKETNTNHAPLPYGYLYKAALEIAESEERKNTTLRAHTERLAEALEEVQGYGRCDMGHQQMCDYITEVAEEALTLYRAENPKK